MIKYYIYGLYKNNELIYVGRSYSPYTRSRVHARDIDFDYCKILDIQEDLETKWILQSLEQGHQLLNKLRVPSCERWKIGDIVHFKN